VVPRTGWLASVSLLVLFTAAPVSAQEKGAPSSIMSSDEVSDLVTDHAADLAERRSALRAFLQLDEVRRAAESAGIDIGSAESAVSTLSAEEMDRIDPMLRDAEAALAGEGLISFAIGVCVLIILILVIF